MIPFLDLKKINQPYEAAFQEKLKAVLDNGWYILGNEVKAFESNFANYCGTKYCVGVGNGFDALVLIFKGYIQLGKLQKGDEVIVPANTYIASILAILQADLIPVMVEPKLETYNINPALIEEKITSKTKAILVVHLYGQLAEMDLINEIALANDLLVVEDAAQAHGTIRNQESVISNQKSSVAYSFYPGKNLGALGDGGAVTTNDLELAKVIHSLRNYGSETKYYNDYIGVNSRLNELQAAFLNVKLPNLDAENEKRSIIAKRYLSEIKNDKIILPTILSRGAKQSNHVFHLFVIRTQNRKELQDYLYNNSIQTVIHYPVPPHKQKAFSHWNHLRFPITEKIHNEVLSLPISPVLTVAEVDFIIAVLNQY
ncbi:DegT/DnrJ/EryC1/StrS family aminotransferase [Flavobacterium caseinilyticum]|uniref:DegT/DnrJ/EryC1/StrS family aminotransferase n=1 Tax=Flavobacterium caseinilyticum TaxID=2541732 RepID=A0A4R5AQU6_9FLAO|nr:DegT/DnrJ/EryC1/StrS family aminotransferase [Flavobacterium caseinilyticum]TDD74046.1 DegT/DnrJ/EryC1/StrS family aminotransferase [Flavobacterium caseinilyticum]